MLNDTKAIELVEQMDYDFSTIDTNFPPAVTLHFVARAKQFDEKVKAYIREHPHASVVNIGAGLDTTFYRIDNGTIHWYDLDLPAVIDVRRQLLPEPDRVTYIAKSLLDPSWCDDIEHTEDGVFMIAGEVLQFFEEAQVKQFFSMLADNFPDGEIVFTAMSRSDEGFREWMDMFPPEQRDAMRASMDGGVEGLVGKGATGPEGRGDNRSQNPNKAEGYGVVRSRSVVEPAQRYGKGGGIA